jgi:ABC-type cobalamin/Fe3+-siderophores transport system ATPase subunit
MSLSITSLSTTAGFLQGSPITFQPGLTCIIGARGTCKSTVVETIRFAFNCDPARVAELESEPLPTAPTSGPSSKGLIRATLQGGIAKCSTVHNSATGPTVIEIERDVGSPPRLYRDGIEELADRSVLNCVEIYSQGDLQRIAENESLRLELIDRPNKPAIDALVQERSLIAKELQGLGPQIRARAADAEARRADVRALDQLRAQLAQAQLQRPQLPAELDRERTEATRRSAIVEASAKWVAARKTFVSEVSDLLARTSLPPLPAELNALDADAGAVLHAEAESLVDLLATLRDCLGRCQADLDPVLNGLRAACERHNGRYYTLRREQQEVNDSLKREDALNQQIVHLEKVRTELQTFEVDLVQLKDKRDVLRHRMAAISDRVYSLRQGEVERINQRHHATIILTLQQGSHTADYSSRLISLLQGSRIRGQDDVAREIASQFTPAELISIVETSDVTRLTTVLGRDAGQMTRVLAYLADRAELYSLEATVFEDYLEITMYDHDVPKPINQLSKGQMATALLPLILRPAPYPLIFDQPEDDLDNSFIYETLVSEIKELKSSRQLIFVTHNANIPVLGEADTVVVMEMETPRSARTPAQGSVDNMKEHVLRLLEGGAEAFRCRQQQYHSLLDE